MLRALYTSAAGMKAQELQIDNTANNLANVNTTGFKRSQLEFADLLYTTLEQPGTSASATELSPTGLQIGSGVRAVGTAKIFSPGSPQQTGNKLDIAIEGSGFLKVIAENGQERYTRAGSLRVGEGGVLVTPSGLQLADPVTIPDEVNVDKVNIAPDGTVTAPVEGVPDAVNNLGSIRLYRFVNPAGLSSEGGNLYAATQSSGAEIAGVPTQNGLGSLQQGFVEGSNVEVVTELISLISAQRAYEINSRAIKAGDEMLSTSADIVR